MITNGVRSRGSGIRWSSRSRTIRRSLQSAVPGNGGAVQGLMQDTPLTLDHFFRRGERLFASKEIVTAVGGTTQRRTYGQWADRSRRLGTVLDQLGISASGRVGTFAWNT